MREHRGDHSDALSNICWAGDLDVLVHPAGAAPYDALHARAEGFDLGDLDVLVASLEDLMAMRRAGGRDKDRLDPAELEVIARLRREVERASG